MKVITLTPGALDTTTDNSINNILDSITGGLSVGDMVGITGKIYTARDAAHKRLVEIIQAGGKPPFGFEGQAVFYAGPSPARPGRPIGSIGPTTSGRMDAYSPLLISKGLKLMIGKGQRSREVVEAIVRHRGLCFAAIGGTAALMAKCVKSARVIAFPELGTEAVRELEVENLPVIVVMVVLLGEAPPYTIFFVPLFFSTKLIFLLYIL